MCPPPIDKSNISLDTNAATPTVCVLQVYFSIKSASLVDHPRPRIIRCCLCRSRCFAGVKDRLVPIHSQRPRKELLKGSWWTADMFMALGIARTEEISQMSHICRFQCLTSGTIIAQTSEGNHLILTLVIHELIELPPVIFVNPRYAQINAINYHHLLPQPIRSPPLPHLSLNERNLKTCLPSWDGNIPSCTRKRSLQFKALNAIYHTRGMHHGSDGCVLHTWS